MAINVSDSNPPRPRILLVEDEPIVLLDVTHILTDLGYEVAGTATTGEQAVSLAAALAPDLIIMDIVLQGAASGIDAARAIRSNAPIPIIYMTANADPATIDAARDTGPSGYVTKPVSSTDLHSNIESALYKDRMERRLRESEARFRTLFHFAGEGILVAEVESKRFTYANPAICKMLGYTEEELLRLSVGDIHPPEAVASVVREFMSQARGDTILAADIPCLRKDRTVIYADINTSAMMIDGRECNVGFFTDITARKDIERALRDNEEKYRRLIETTDTGFVIVDGRGHVVDANDIYVKMTGHATLEQIRGRNVLEWTAAHDRERNDAAVAQCAALGFIRGFEVEYEWPNGVIIPIEINATVTGSGDAARILTLCRDISERVGAARALRESEERFRLAAQATGQLVYDYDIPAGVINWAGAIAAITGFTPEEMRAVDINEWEEMIHPDDRARATTALERSINTGTLYSIEYRFRVKGGSYMDIEDVGAFIPDRNGVPYRMVGTMKDISERKRAARELAETTKRLESILSITRTGVDIIDADYNLRYVDPGWQKVYGDPAGRKCYEYFMGCQRPCSDCGIPAAITSRQITITEEVLPREGNRAIEVHTIPFQNPDGEWLVAEFNIDITERKKAETALRASEQKFITAFNSTPVLMAISTIDTGQFFEVNQSFLDVLGFSREEVIGKTSRDLGLFDDVSRRDEIMSALERDGFARDFDVQVRTRSGVLRNGSFSADIVELEGERYLLTAMNDITERKKAEEALERERNQFVSGPMVAFKWRAEPGWPEEYVSPNVSRWGYDPASFIEGRTSYLDIIHPDDRERIEREVARYGEAGTPSYEQEYRVFTASGEVRWVHDFTVVIRDAAGAVTHYDGYLSDITERKKAEEDRARLEDQLRQSQKIESIGRLAGGVAHDFNNLLTAITGNISLALMDVPAGDALAETLKDAMKAAESAAALTRQLLAFSRKQIVEPRVVGVNDLVSNMKKMLGRIIGEDIALKTVLAPDAGAVRIDPGQFEQIIINLTVNARDAMPGGGELIIETATLDLDEEYASGHPYVSPGPYVLISVSDTGSGMSSEVKEHLYEPFYTTKPKGKGTGLGLATIYGAVKQNGGSIEVYSEVGLGSTFKIFFPRVADGSEATLPGRLVGDFPRGTETLLLVEDDPAVRGLAVRLLSRLGYRLMVFGNPMEALHAVEAHAGAIDLMVTDVVMPGMNGLELAQRVGKLRPGLRILFSSGYSEEVIAHHGIIDRGLNFIAKPYRPQDLAKKIREVIDGPATA